MTFLEPAHGASIVQKLRGGRELATEDLGALVRLVLEQPGVERALQQAVVVEQLEAMRRADPLLSVRSAAARIARRNPTGPGPEAIRRWVRERGPFPRGPCEREGQGGNT